MIFSAFPFSTQPFSASGRQTWVFLDSEIESEISLSFVVYAATKQFATAPDDALPSQPFRGVLRSYSFTRSILDTEIGSFRPGTGRLVIDNFDAHYDFLPQFYTFDARPITIRVTQVGGSYDAAFPLGVLTADSSAVDIDNLEISLRDQGYKLDVPMQPTLYGGTGGADGGADLKDKRKPMVFGEAKTIPAVNLVAASLIYQVSDGPVQAIAAVYDRGVALTPGSDHASYAALLAAVVPANTFATARAVGMFKLGSTPAGQVTADVEGDNSDGYVETSADIVRWAIRNRTELVDPDDLVTTSFAAVNATQPASVNYWVGPDDSILVSEFIGNIMGGIGGWGGHRRGGLYEVRIFEAPSGVPMQRFTPKDILGLSEPQRAPLPSAYTPPPWRWRVPFARSWTQETDLAAAATAAHKAFVSEPFRLASAENTAVKVDHPTAQDPDPVQSFFTDAADAEAEAQRRLDLFRATRRIYTITVSRRGLRLELGDIVLLTHERFDLSLGKLMVVVEIAESFDFSSDAIDSVRITLYG